MQKKYTLSILILLFSLFLVGCGKIQNQGEAVVTVSGKIRVKNKGDTYVLHQRDFDTRSKSESYNDPWVKQTLRFKGLLLSDILDIVKPDPDARKMVFKTTNGQTYTVSIGDAGGWPIMLARWENDQILIQNNGYPSKLVFPDAAKDEYGADMWAWWVNAIEIK